MNKKLFILGFIVGVVIVVALSIRLAKNKSNNTETKSPKASVVTDVVQDKVGNLQSSTIDDKTTKIEKLSLKVGDKDRSYTLERPEDKASIKNIIIALHGSGSTGDKIQENLRLSELVSKNKTVIAYPDGVDNSWNDIRVKSEDVDDIGFITQLIQSLQKEYKVNKESTTLLGVSNGGFMVQTLVCQDDTLAKNMVSVVASFLVELAEQCKSLPVNSVYVLGQKDTIVPYAGGDLVTPIKGQALSAEKTLTNAAQINKCSDGIEEKEATSVLIQKINGCQNNGQVALITYVNESHISLPLRVDFVSIIRENELVK